MDRLNREDLNKFNGSTLMKQYFTETRLYINADWAGRKETAASVADRLDAFLRNISLLHSTLSRWDVGSVSPRIFPDTWTASELLIAADRTRAESGEIEPDGGYGVLATSRDERQRFGFNGTAGAAYPLPFSNRIGFHTYAGVEPDYSIVDYAMFRQLMLAIIECWACGVLRAVEPVEAGLPKRRLVRESLDDLRAAGSRGKCRSFEHPSPRDDTGWRSAAHGDDRDLPSDDLRPRPSRSKNFAGDTALECGAAQTVSRVIFILMKPAHVGMSGTTKYLEGVLKRRFDHQASCEPQDRYWVGRGILRNPALPTERVSNRSK